MGEEPGKRLRAVALFAATYGFLPSACRSVSEAVGLMENAAMVLAIKSIGITRGAGALFKSDVAADLAEDVGASPRKVIELRMRAMREEAQALIKGAQ